MFSLSIPEQIDAYINQQEWTPTPDSNPLFPKPGAPSQPAGTAIALGRAAMGSGWFTIAEYMTRLGTAKCTVNNNMNRWHDKGLIEKKTSPNGRNFWRFVE